MILLCGDPGVERGSRRKKGIIEMDIQSDGSDKYAGLIENINNIFFGIFAPLEGHDKKISLIIREYELECRKAIRKIDLVFYSRRSVLESLLDGLFVFLGYFNRLILFSYLSF